MIIQKTHKLDIVQEVESVKFVREPFMLKPASAKANAKVCERGLIILRVTEDWQIHQASLP